MRAVTARADARLLDELVADAHVVSTAATTSPRGTRSTQPASGTASRWSPALRSASTGRFPSMTPATTSAPATPACSRPPRSSRRPVARRWACSRRWWASSAPCRRRRRSSYSAARALAGRAAADAGWAHDGMERGAGAAQSGVPGAAAVRSGVIAGLIRNPSRRVDPGSSPG